MLAYSFQEKKKIHPTRSYLRAFYRQAAPNFAYSFIKFEEKIPAYSFIWAYSFIRELRVADYCLKFETSKLPTYLYFQQSKGPPSKQA